MEIIRIELHKSGELSVTPINNWNNLFHLIYRTATGVKWNEKSQCFMSPVPREWSYLDWYANIVTSVQSEIGVNLKVTKKTEWLNVPKELKKEILNCDPVLISNSKHDLKVVDNILHAANYESPEYYSIRPIKIEAHEAWENKEYEKVVELYKSVENKLSEVEKKRLKLAQKMLKGKERF